jgi:Leucine-rich repeat (LRR) protein
MAVDRVIRFGLNVNRNLADIVNNTQALANIGVDIKDLDVIRDAAGDLGITADDVKALSGLGVPLQTYLTKLYTDTQQYASIIDQTAGTTEPLKGNLTINGQLGATSIKYQYIDKEDDVTLKYADISTSRISSWSSPDSPNSTAQSPIFYGGAVEVDGPVDTPNIELLEQPLAVRFRDSEVPTHKIEVTVNGSTLYFYAMKGIPLIFRGFFRDFNSDLRLVSRGAVSWRVVNNTADYLTREYENVGGSNTTRSFLRYRDTKAASKDIEIYHNPNNILTLPMFSVGLEELPAAQLEGLRTLYLYRNLIRTMPDFTVFCPNIFLLDVRENNMELGGDPNLRKFNNNVLARIPKSATEIRFGNTFNGSITANIKPDTITAGNFVTGKEYTILSFNDGLGGATTDFTAIGAGSNTLYNKFTATGPGTGTGTAADLSTGLPNLITFDVNSHGRGGARNFFGRDSDDPTGSLPEVHITCRNYYAYRNAFDTIPRSILDLPDLRQLQIYANSIIEPNFQIASDTIDYINIGNNPGINIPNLTGKTTLRNFYSHYNRASGIGTDNNLLVTESGDYKFLNCSSLIRIYTYSNNFVGPVPKFSGNTALYEFEARYSRVEGGKLIPASSMVNGKEYQIFYNPDFNNDSNPDFDFTQVGAASNTKGTIFTADLSVNTISSAVPKVIDRQYVLWDDLFDDCQAAMQYFRISSSFMLDKPLHPDLFSKSFNMRGIEIRTFGRGVSGPIPSLSAMQSLRYFVALQNKFTGPVPSLFNNPNVYYVHLFQNQLSGQVPQIESTALQFLYLHYNQLTGFNGLVTPNLRRLFLNNNLIEGNIPDMNNLELCYDLYLNNNKWSGYTPGSIVGMRSLLRFDLSNNPTLTGQSVNDIIADCVKNYEANPRGGVAVNLANTATVTGDAVDQIEFLRSVGWNMRN